MDSYLFRIARIQHSALVKLGKYLQTQDEFINPTNVLRKTAEIHYNEHFRFFGGTLFYFWFVINGPRKQVLILKRWIKVNNMFISFYLTLDNQSTTESCFQYRLCIKICL